MYYYKFIATYYYIIITSLLQLANHVISLSQLLCNYHVLSRYYYNGIY